MKHKWYMIGYLIVLIPLIAECQSGIMDLFLGRDVWNRLPKNSIKTLAERLATPEKANEFISLCEKSGILENYFIENLEGGDPEFDMGSIAAVLTSYANTKGREANYFESKRSLELVILIKPRYVSAWRSMAITFSAMGDCKSAVVWAKKALAFKPDINSKDPWEEGMVFSEMEEGKEMAKKAGLEGGDWDELNALMNEIIMECSKK